jgi:glucose/arabinose dehydrogenase
VRWRLIVVLAVVLVVLVGAGGWLYSYGEPKGWFVSASVEDAPEVDPEVETVASGLRVPWDLAFLPDGSALVTERVTGRLRMIGTDGAVSEVRTFEDVGQPANMAGLQGIAVSPSYAEDGWVYVYYSTADDSRVVRLHLDDDAAPEPVLTGIPRGDIHNGGRIRFGPDEMLYVTTGEAGNVPERAQDRDDLGGKILRMTPDGDVPPDNPFPDSLTYAYGFRDPQGIAWDDDGQLYASEFGHQKLDELNRVEAGADYGWPEVEGPGGGFTDPVATFKPADASPSGMTWHDGQLWIASLRGERVYRIDPDGANAEQMLTGEYGRLRLVTEAPDGSLWVLTNDRPGPDHDLVLRMNP